MTQVSDDTGRENIALQSYETLEEDVYLNEDIDQISEIAEVRLFKEESLDTVSEGFLKRENGNGSYGTVINGDTVRVPRFNVTTGNRRKPEFITFQKWEGYVEDVRKDTFTARLIDLTEERDEEFAEFPIKEVPERDHELIEEGAVFYWSIGRKREFTGTIEKSSRIRFRRMPRWTEEEIEQAKKDAKKRKEKIDRKR